MGWMELPPYFCTPTETARDIATEYLETGIGTWPQHKFEQYATGLTDFNKLPATSESDYNLRYMLEVSVDDFVSLVISTSQAQLRHIANAIMEGIHDVFPPDDNNGNNLISKKKLLKDEGRYSTIKTLLGFDFDGKANTIWLEDTKQEKLLATLQSWIRLISHGTGGIPYKQFESTIAKLRHAFTAIPARVGLLSPCNRILAGKPPIVWLSGHKRVLAAVKGCRTLLRESTKDPTQCKELVTGWTDSCGNC
jgi:hypothetical protein